MFFVAENNGRFAVLRTRDHLGKPVCVADFATRQEAEREAETMAKLTGELDPADERAPRDMLRMLASV